MALISFLLLHFVAVTAYVWPGKNSASKLSLYSYAYVYPYFHQNWNLFVPVPKQNFSLCVKYKIGNIQKDWTDIFYQINSAHQNNRFAGNESALLAFSNALRYYAGSVTEANEVITDKHSNLNFLIIEKAVRAYLEEKEKSHISELKISIGITSLGSVTHQHYYSENN